MGSGRSADVILGIGGVQLIVVFWQRTLHLAVRYLVLVLRLVQHGI